jgi:hypothetical protein
MCIVRKTVARSPNVKAYSQTQKYVVFRMLDHTFRVILDSRRLTRLDNLEAECGAGSRIGLHGM